MQALSKLFMHIPFRPFKPFVWSPIKFEFRPFKLFELPPKLFELLLLFEDDDDKDDVDEFDEEENVFS